jgi:thiol-disulfide isomerase/thioredoxin
MNPKRLACPLLLAGLLSASLLAVAGHDDPPAPPLRPGDTAPGFQAKLLSDRTVKFPDSYRGKYVLLDFWATWCGPCRAEFPHVKAVQQKFATRGLQIVGVSLDALQNRGPDVVKRFVEQEKLRWDHVYDADSALMDAYRVKFIPAAFLIDAATGKIIAAGDDLSGDNLAKTLDRVLPKAK